MLKLSSVAEHSAKPPIIGISDKLTYIPVFSPIIPENQFSFVNEQSR